jgi:hypothetical protein
MGTFRKLIFRALMAIVFVFFINTASKIVFNKKFPNLNIDTAALSGGQAKLTYFMRFSWPTCGAGLYS